MTWRLTGSDLRSARRTLGEMWGLGRPLHTSEMARALGLGGKQPGSTIVEWEERQDLSGPASIALGYMLDGASPRVPMAEIVTRRKHLPS